MNRPDHDQFGRAMSLFLLAAGSVLVWHAPRTAAAEDSDASRPEYRRTREVPEEVLDPRPRKVIVLPSEPGDIGEDPLERSQGAIGSLEPEQRLLPDGYMVARRPATVESEGRWKVLRLESVQGLPDAPPLRVLPNRRLEILETILSSHNGAARLIVTGRVTEFQGDNYVLLEDIAEPPRTTIPSRSDEGEAKSRPAATTPNETGSDERGPSATQPDREPTAEQIMKRLLGDRPEKSVVMPGRERVAEEQPVEEQDEAQQGKGVFAPKETANWPENALLMDRLGRVVPGDEWWMLAFENLGDRPGDKPVRLLPNRLLETALKISGAGTKAQVIRITGEVTEYKGVNYLLLRKVLVRHDTGNLH